MHKGDGLSVGELSVMDSYSAGATSYQSRSTTEEATESVTYEEYHKHQHRGGRRGEGSSSSNDHHHRYEDRHDQQWNDRKSKSRARDEREMTPKSRPPPPPPAAPPPLKSRYRREEKSNEYYPPRHHHHPKKGGDSVRTDNSTAYHHGYQMRNSDDDETREEPVQERRNETSPRRAAASPSRREREHRVPAVTKHTKQKVPPKRMQSSIAELAPVETDMAFYNGSQDELEARQNTAVPVEDEDIPSDASSVLESLARLVNEQEHLEQELLKISSSYSTLTDCMTDTLHAEAQKRKKEKNPPPPPPPLQKKKTKKKKTHDPPEQKEQHAQQKVGTEEQPIQIIDDEDEEDYRDSDDSSADIELKELLKQQQMQEEKLREQLGQLQIQKAKLQQMQEEKKRTTTKKIMENDDEVQVVRTNIDTDGPRAKPLSVSNDNVFLSPEGDKGRDEQEIMDRLDLARQKTAGMAKTEAQERLHNDGNDDEPVVISLHADGDFQSLEDKYAGESGSKFLLDDDDEDVFKSPAVTGEMEGMLPEVHQNTPLKIETSHSPEDGGEPDDNELSEELHEPMEEEQEGEGSFGALSEIVSSVDDEIDLEFVAKYDRAFNAFLDAHPSLFDRDSDLVQNLKVAKLQKILEVSYETECDLEAHLDETSDVKSELEESFQQKLKDASSTKAARSIQLQSDLHHAKKQSKAMQGKLTMDIISTATKRAKKINDIKVELKAQDMTSRENLITAAVIPYTEVKEAVETVPVETSDEEKKQMLRQYQVDNAILNAELKVLEKKILNLKEAAKKQAWVDAVLLRMDEKKLRKLKTRYEKKLGVSF